jgi:hypothetical protein
MASKPTEPVAPKRQKDVVHEDRNWVTRIHDELNSGENWNKQWGYLSGGIGTLDATSQSKSITSNLDERINELEEVQQRLSSDHQ